MRESLTLQYRIVPDPSRDLERELVDLVRRDGVGRPPFLVVESVDVEEQGRSVLRMMDILGVPVPNTLDEASWTEALRVWLPLMAKAREENSPAWMECEQEIEKRDATPFVQFVPSAKGWVMNLPARCLHRTNVLDRSALEVFLSGNLGKTVHAIGSRFGDGDDAIEMTDVLFEDAASAAAATILLLSQETGSTYAVYDERMPSASDLVDTFAANDVALDEGTSE